MLRLDRVVCKYHASNARCGKTVARDGRRKRPGHDLWKLPSTEHTAGDSRKHGLIGKGKNVHNAQSATDSSIPIPRSVTEYKNLISGTCAERNVEHFADHVQISVFDRRMVGD